MSPRAACRLEQLGFTDVYDYVPGKSDWMAAGLDREGEGADRLLYAGDLATAGVPTCRPSDRLDETAAQMQTTFCVVSSDDGVVLGMLHAAEAPDQPGAHTVEQAMHQGATTVRANEPAEPLLDRMREAGVGGILVTDPEGRLLGLVDRTDAEQPFA